MNMILFCIFSLASVLFQARANSNIIGEWESLEARDGFRVFLKFGSGGVCSRTVGFTCKGTYRIEGDRIFESYFKNDNQNDESIEFRIEGDTLVLKIDEDEWRWNRVTHKGHTGAPIVGKWAVNGYIFHGDKALYEMEFTKDGQFRLRMQREPEKGRYKIKGDLLITTIGREREAGKFRFEDGLLILKCPPATGSEERYNRVEW